MEHEEHEQHYRHNQKDSDKQQPPMLIELLQRTPNKSYLHSQGRAVSLRRLQERAARLAFFRFDECESNHV